MRTGPVRSLESRTATAPGRLAAAWTQLPLPPLWVLVRQAARDRSGVGIPRIFPHGRGSSLSAAAMSISRVSFGPRAAACTNRNASAYQATSAGRSRYRALAAFSRYTAPGSGAAKSRVTNGPIIAGCSPAENRSTCTVTTARPRGGQVPQLRHHHRRAADHPPHRRFVDDGPEPGPVASRENLLPGHPDFGAPGDLLGRVVGPGDADDGPGVVLGLEQSGDEFLLVIADGGGLGFQSDQGAAGISVRRGAQPAIWQDGPYPVDPANRPGFLSAS
jgi:hypothetical protein